ncbi:inovirus Gp2 family protein [Vibrio algarum]|uniref:Inovirus Gp2 family protein n=1 Tax=Vibrio algarum TaxID=3020714 RepID=A0ABT4YL35_9VIBR|nr:inovirus Gp2 family protein [Vibrio sp. KJ40-1]MDB1122242.1 inovirus Gp2 family protein [Vibrio sp. KJ40-1]
MYFNTYQGSQFLGLPINSNHPMNESYLNATHQVLLNAMNQHPRTLVFHVVLRYPMTWHTGSDNSISRFIKAFKAKVAADLNRRQKEGKRVHPTNIRYVWCRESNSSIKEHYHVFFLMNADTYWQFGRFENLVPGELTWMLNSAWASAINVSENDAVGLVHFCDGIRRIDAKKIAGSHTVEKDGVMRDSFESVFNWMSYLSKASTKQYGRGGRNFGYSYS